MTTSALDARELLALTAPGQVTAGAKSANALSLVRSQVRTDTPLMSVIVPAYRDAEHIAANLDRLSAALDATGHSWEVIVVSDGDLATYEAASTVVDPRIRVLGYEHNQGKGFALRHGMALASGALVTMIDSDMEIDPGEIGRMASLMALYDADVVVGSKRHPLSSVHYPVLRRFQSACYQVLVRLLFRIKVRDTQTGLKMLRREVATKVLEVALVKRFAFDLELLVLARHYGFRRVIEAPVNINYSFQSTTNLRAAARVLCDTLAIFYRLRIRHYYDPCRRAPGTMAPAALPPLPVEPRASSTSLS
jgi:glycosyltransferase involved in cell wall biosynthesis